MNECTFLTPEDRNRQSVENSGLHNKNSPRGSTLRRGRLMGPQLWFRIDVEYYMARCFGEGVPLEFGDVHIAWLYLCEYDRHD